MYVMEVQPKRAWRGLRMRKDSLVAAATTPRHSRASHWFQKETAEYLLRSIQIRHAGLELDPAPEQLRVEKCACRPEELRTAGPRRPRPPGKRTPRTR